MMALAEASRTSSFSRCSANVAPSPPCAVVHTGRRREAVWGIAVTLTDATRRIKALIPNCSHALLRFLLRRDPIMWGTRRLDARYAQR